MDNSSYRRQFIESYVSDNRFTELSIRTFEDIWKRIGKAEEALEKSLEDGYSKEDYINLLERLNVATIPVLTVMKSKILQYVEYINTAGLIPDDCVKALKAVTIKDLKVAGYYDSRYFKDFPSLQDAIDSTLIAAERVDDAIFGTAITAIYLAWCGLTIEEAMQVKKSDVLDDCIVTAGKTIRPITQIMEYIKDYRDATEYKSLGRAIITLKYVPSEWLLRNTRCDRFDQGQRLRISINQFGNSSEESKNLFNYDKIYWSGVYSRAYIYERTYGVIQANDVTKIEEIFGEKYPTVALANRRLYDYHLFREHFFPTYTPPSKEEA